MNVYNHTSYTELINVIKSIVRIDGGTFDILKVYVHFYWFSLGISRFLPKSVNFGVLIDIHKKLLLIEPKYCTVVFEQKF